MRVVQALGEELPQELQGGRVHPVQVLDDEQDRPPGGARVQPLQQGPERLFPLPGRRTATSGGKRSGVGSDSSDAHSGTVSGRARSYCSRRRSSRSNRAGGGSSRPKARARSKKSMAGYSPVFW